MTVSDWGGLFFGAVSVYLLWEQNQIFRRQNEIFAGQAEGQNVPSDLRPRSFRRYWPLIAMAVLAFLTWSAIGYDYYDRRTSASFLMKPAEWDNYPSKEIKGQHFSHETVVLDGNNFTDCYFDQVTMSYEGLLPFKFTGTSHFNQPIVLRTTNARIYNYLILLGQLGILNPVQTRITGGHLNLGVPNDDLGPLINRPPLKK